jgi:nitrate reductase NapE component
MTEAANTSETSVNFYQTTRRNNPEEITFLFVLFYLTPVIFEVDNM